MSFITYLKENNSINEKIENINDYSIDYVISKGLFMGVQSHVWHLLAKSGQKHIALKELYESLADLCDGIAEKYIAQGGAFMDKREFVLVQSYDNYAIIESINLFREDITSLISSIKDISSLQSILDSLVDFQELIDSFIYKFNLE